LRQPLARRFTALNQPGQPKQIAVAIKEGMVEIKKRQSHQAGAPGQGSRHHASGRGCIERHTDRPVI
jgi:hypothetical protein